MECVGRTVLCVWLCPADPLVRKQLCEAFKRGRKRNGMHF